MMFTREIKEGNTCIDHNWLPTMHAVFHRISMLLLMFFVKNDICFLLFRKLVLPTVSLKLSHHRIQVPIGVCKTKTRTTGADTVSPINNEIKFTT